MVGRPTWERLLDGELSHDNFMAFELLAHPFIGDADHAKIYRIGRLGFGSPGNFLPLGEPFRQCLREWGYVAFEYRWAESSKSVLFGPIG